MGLKLWMQTVRNCFWKLTPFWWQQACAGISAQLDSWHELAGEVIFVGDCRKASKIQEAMRTGYCAGLTI